MGLAVCVLLVLCVAYGAGWAAGYKVGAFDEARRQQRFRRSVQNARRSER